MAGGSRYSVLRMKSSLMDINLFVCPVSKTALKYQCQDYGMRYTAKIKQEKKKKTGLAIQLESAFQIYFSNPDKFCFLL